MKLIADFLHEIFIFSRLPNRQVTFPMHLRHLIILVTLFIGCSINLCAQKKSFQQAKTILKTRKDLYKVESLMHELLKDSTLSFDNRLKANIYLYESYRISYDIENEKLFLKHPYDTLSILDKTRQLFVTSQIIDSLTTNTNQQQKFRNKNRDYLAKIRPNLLFGGNYFANRSEFEKAFALLSLYIESKNYPIFANYLSNDDDLTNTAAALSVYCGYRLNAYEKTMRYSELALKDRAQEPLILQYISQAYKSKNDTTNYLKTLERGFKNHSENLFFFSRLVDYYNNQELFDKSLEIIDEALKKSPDEVVFLFAKSSVMLNTQQFDECIELSKQIIAKNDSLPEAYYNLGASYYNKAISLEKIKRKSRTTKNSIQELYSTARPCMEHYKQLSPEQKDKWGPILYKIYLNLNLGKEFDELNKLLN